MHAFTLIELMISIALVVILILGVNQVFTYTAAAVGSGEAINAAVRSSRAAQATLASDFAGIVHNGSGVNDAACMIISSRAYYSYQNAKDQASQGKISSSAPSSLPNAAFADFNGDGISGDTTVPGEVTYPATYNFRNHRLDVISFFSRGLFPRQTGNPGVFVDNMASTEAWVWYGHLHLPDNSGNFQLASLPSKTFPCIGSSATNPNNYFGSQLTLGRVAMLLVPATNHQSINDNSTNPQWFFANFGSPNLVPLAAFNSAYQVNPSNTEPGNVNQVSGGATYNFPTARVDLADTSISEFRSQNFLPTGYPIAYWWDAMMDGNPNPSTSYFTNGHNNCTRFQANPVAGKPMQSWNMANTVPILMTGCSQFIVEFAGDFLTQDNNPTDATYGSVTALAADGQLDYVLTQPNGPGTTKVKQIMWYGMPRQTHTFTTGSNASQILASNGDVVPVNDLLQHYGINPSYATFEKTYPAYQSSGYGQGNMSITDANNGYICAFGPTDPHPSLIRITMTLEDPTGRLQQGQTYQYVFAVP
jgi:prepilin-type N-terminal cleavage/methylation domain-containing protein